jgi:salicylate biosynthesis isochorismate synthase
VTVTRGAARTAAARRVADTDPAPLPIAATLRALTQRPDADAGGEGRLAGAIFGLPGGAIPDPIALFAAALDAGLEPSLWLKPVDGFALVGIGCAWSVQADGPERFTAVAEAWERLLAGSRLGGETSAVRAVGPLLVGGLGFTGDLPVDPGWLPFGAASMSVPELLVAQTPAGGWLTASFVATAGTDAHASTAREAPERLERLWTSLLADVAAAAGQSPPHAGDAQGPVPLTVVAEQPDRRTWDRLVDRFAGAVGRGRLDKVVLARRRDLTSAVDIDTVAAVRRLAAGSPTSTTYAFVRGGNVFLGATPERLISTQGKDFQTVAMAGSIRHDDDVAREASLAAELLSSDKDREEHEIVVDMIRTLLEPVAAEIHVAPSPVVATFGTVQHLVTTVTGRLRDRAGILKLAGLLHPTPAVGGEPRALALELIAEHEGFERGWYAGPLGWVGADGDGEFVVALRCAVVSGRNAALFAGCGIVADSDPEREWEESRNKMLVVASALGELES